MADCFWTDFVACAEDCATPTPATGPAVLLGLGAAMGAGGSGIGDAIPYLPLTGERIAGALQFDTVDVYAASVDSGCSWAGFVATTDASLAGTTISDTYDPNGNSGYSVTWKLVADFAKSFLASGTNVVLSPMTDGLGGSFINTTDLLTELGAIDEYSNVGLLIVATLRDTTSGDTWEATWALDTCY
ncbi:hypothetical protein [Rhodanobacter lindaniclasticus]